MNQDRDPTNPDAAATSTEPVELETRRLLLRRLTEADAGFILELFNDPSFRENIGDRGIRTREDARSYVRTGPTATYASFGFALYRVERKGASAAIGICGLLKRDPLPDPDLGFAFLPAFRSRGYATEAGTAVLDHARASLGLSRILAIAAPANAGSKRVLEKLGFELERMVRIADDEPELCLYATGGAQRRGADR